MSLHNPELLPACPEISSHATTTGGLAEAFAQFASSLPGFEHGVGSIELMMTPAEEILDHENRIEKKISPSFSMVIHPK